MLHHRAGLVTIVTILAMEVVAVGDPPQLIPLQHPYLGDTAAGSVFAHDCDGDGRLDLVLTQPGRVSVYAQDGALRWSVESPILLSDHDQPGAHHPGAFAGDIDADGDTEIGWLTHDGRLELRDGATGDLIDTFEYPGAKVALIADLRGAGDADAVLQYSQTELRAVRLDTGEPLWHTTDWLGVEHGPARVADIDGDGRDEVVGIEFVDDDGLKMNRWNLKRDRSSAVSSMDSVVIADLVPGGPLEVALAEQGGNNEAIVVTHEAILWGTFHRPPTVGQCGREIDPDKLAVGDFDPERTGLEVFCRSACGREPWMLDAQGRLIVQWRVEDTAPDGWFLGGERGPEGSEGGLESVVAIDWHGRSSPRLIAAKERHLNGSVAVIDPRTGRFVHHWPTRAARLYVADLGGDAREEIVIVEPADERGHGTIRVFRNDRPPADADQPSPWDRQHYRRQKQNWNYYSP